MTQFECEGCGAMLRLLEIERSSLRRHCPVCEAETRWTTAFEDHDRGVSY